jgi:hypothetical protein
MKKISLIIGCVSLLAGGLFFAACGKDEWKGCTCTEIDGSYTGTFTVTAAEAKAAGAESCAQVATYQRLSLGMEASVSCSDL